MNEKAEIDLHLSNDSKVKTEDVLVRVQRESKLSEHNRDPSRYGVDYVVRWKDLPLTVSNIFNLSLEDKEEVAKFLFAHFRENGFPYPKFSEEELREDWKKLCEFDSSSVCSVENGANIISSGSTVGNVIFKHFNPHFFEVSEAGRNKRSMKEAFDNDDLLMKVIRNRLGITFFYRGVSYPFTITGNMLRQGFRSMHLAPQTSNFRPTIAKFFYEKYVPEEGLIFDYSSGFNQRLIGAASSNKKFFYVGVDPWERTINAGREIINYFNLPRAKLVRSVSEDFCKESMHGKVHFAFSSPPYMDKEIFTREDTQAFANGYDSFLNVYWNGTVKNIKKMLRKDGLFGINISEKQGKYQLKNDMIDIVQKNGFELSESYFMKLSKSHLTKKVGTESLTKLEGIYIFRQA